MRALLFFVVSFSFLLCSTLQITAQQLQAEDVLYTAGQHQLKYKHLLAYTNIEMEGEDPALLNDQTFIKNLTQECIEEFLDAPAEFSQEMDQHFQVMLMGGGFQMGKAQQQSAEVTAQPTTQTKEVSSAQLTEVDQWKQVLSGNILYATTTQSSGQIFIQNTQVIHFCPDGVAYNYSISGGGGTVGGIDITDPRNFTFEGAFNWNVIARGGISYFQFSLQGASQFTPIQIVNNKIVLQGLGNFSLQRGGARCQ